MKRILTILLGKIKVYLGNTHFHALTQSFNQLSMLFTTSQDKNFPFEKMKVNKNVDKDRNPWVTKCVLKSIEKKHNCKHRGHFNYST